MSDFRYEAFSVEHPSNSIFTILTSVIGGFFIAFTFVAHYIEYKKVMDIGDTGDTDDTDDTADLSEDEDIDLANKYYEELSTLVEREMTKTELDALQFSLVNVDTPDGKVLMTYNNSTESFWYYTDNKSIPYNYLDEVARFFTIEYNCRQICVNYKEEYEKGVINLNTLIAENKRRIEELTAVTKKSVFAKFKKYKQADNTKQKYYVMTDRANLFKYSGTIADYELCKKAKLVEIPKMDYATFKRMGVKNVGV